MRRRASPDPVRAAKTAGSHGRRGEVEAALRHIAPRMPAYEFEAVVDHAMDSPGLSRAVPGEAAWLSLTAYVRHTETDYDDLLAEGYDGESARHFVLDAMRAVLGAWGVRRPITAGAEDG